MAISVLVVDDDGGLREAVSTILREEGYAVDGAPDGMAAMMALRASRQRQVVLLDMRMPKLDGHQVLEVLAEDPKLARRHAYILFSATADVHHLVPGLRRLVADHCVGVLAKPFELEQLLDLVQQAARTLT